MPTIPSPLKIRLTSEEKQWLFELKNNPKIPQRTKDRAEAVEFTKLQL
ncbi:MAG: hypothetical protein F6K39_12100 [Okeania sp. SIO3B3]|nr:hypothetical protein [Okeania sp. SIO3B3]